MCYDEHCIDFRNPPPSLFGHKILKVVLGLTVPCLRYFLGHFAPTKDGAPQNCKTIFMLISQKTLYIFWNPCVSMSSFKFEMMITKTRREEEDKEKQCWEALRCWEVWIMPRAWKKGSMLLPPFFLLQAKFKWNRFLILYIRPVFSMVCFSYQAQEGEYLWMVTSKYSWFTKTMVAEGPLERTQDDKKHLVAWKKHEETH